MFESFSIIFLVASLLSYINFKWLKLIPNIGTMILALILSISIILTKDIFTGINKFFYELLQSADFGSLLLKIMLSILLFAGAMHIEIHALQKEKWSILVFSTIGVLISTFLIGSAVYFIAPLFGLAIPYIYSLIIGSILSPTDPIAVLGIIKDSSLKESIALKIEGESLFNDGVGVVVFTTLLFIASGNTGNIGEKIGSIFLVEALGGIGLGFLLGWVGSILLKSAQENHQLTTILSVGIVLGGFVLASKLGTSGPLATVVCGLYLGHTISNPMFNKKSKKLMNEIWEILDESLNTILFVLIGLSLQLLSANIELIILGSIVIIIALLARFISIALPFSLLKSNENRLKTSLILTWGGLRGGISIALALSIPEEQFRNTILVLTFMVVIFSILFQGLTLGFIVKKLNLTTKRKHE